MNKPFKTEPDNKNSSNGDFELILIIFVILLLLGS